jgi:trigger factor
MTLTLLFVKVLKEELETEVENAIAEFKRYNQEYDEERVKEQAQELLEGQKVLDWLKEHAEITYVTPQ